ncbi:MAG: tRNA (adenosine(37)-N6)-threonylcarbamoyltransferase complex dimerization subunit type 1 TsaB [Candidatus Latescibacterota bacterium]
MLILALDAATPAVSVALARGEYLLAETYLDVGLQHAARMLAEVGRLFEVTALRPNDVGAVAVTGGPGSFTGLRIGMSAAKGFCLGIGRPLVTVPTLEVLAACLPFARLPVCAMLDARKGEVYAGLYDCSAELPTSLGPAVAAPPEQVLAGRIGQPTIYAGEGARLCRSLIVQDAAALLAPGWYARPAARLVALLALERLRRGETADPATAEPDYLRPADAHVPRPALRGA